jgi:DNA-binding NtrC family response regulator
LASNFKSKLLAPKEKLPESQWIGNKKMAYKYSELLEWNITGKKIKSHFIRSQKLWPGNAKEMAEKFEDFPKFYQQLSENTISEKTIESLFEKQTRNNEMEKFCEGYRTDLEEGFHRVVLKYWRKETSYQYEEYRIRRALAALHWQVRETKRKLCVFRQTIADTFHNFLMQRTKSRNGENKTYIPQIK